MIWKDINARWEMVNKCSTFSVFIGVLEGLHQSEGLINRASHRQVIHGDLPENTFIVDDE